MKDLNNVAPVVTYPHEILQGVDEPLPPLKGFVMTTLKESSLVDQVLVSPDPAERQNATVLASWQYGAGRTVAFTTDAGKRWADEWTSWEGYDKLFSQMVRWAMRPAKEEGNYTIATEVKDGKVRVVIDALDKDDQFINFLSMNGAVIDPELKSAVLPIRQTYPGRYEGEFAATDPGTYLLSIATGAGGAPLLAGVSVPYSSEYSDREANLALLTTLASLDPEGGEKGVVIEGDVAGDDLDPLLKWDTFRHNLRKAVSVQDVWPLFLLVCAMLFFADVFVRRVSVGFEWVAPVAAWARAKVFGDSGDQQEDKRLDRLRSRKQAVAQNIDQRRAAARFEPTVDEDAPTARGLDEVIKDVSAGPAAPPQRTKPAQSSPADAREEEDYTSRLLKAKKKAFKDKKKED